MDMIHNNHNGFELNYTQTIFYYLLRKTTTDEIINNRRIKILQKIARMSQLSS